MKTVVIALGGNAILQAKQRGTYGEQIENIRAACHEIVAIIQAGYRVVLTHGNGPQVGAILLQNEEASATVPAMPLDACGAQTQGLIGYLFQQELGNALAQSGLDRSVISVVTQTEVRIDDPAFQNPTKPVGPYYTQTKIQRYVDQKGWQVKEDAAGRGWRRVVPSPEPVTICEGPVIRQLINQGFIVIASGGGGIPVVRHESGALHGVEAVVDKDLAGYRLAVDVNADVFMILTDVERVALRFGQPDQINLGEITASELRRYQDEGHFKAGSMGPKVEGCLRFAESGKGLAIIASHAKALDALGGSSGTRVIPQ